MSVERSSYPTLFYLGVSYKQNRVKSFKMTLIHDYIYDFIIERNPLFSLVLKMELTYFRNWF